MSSFSGFWSYVHKDNNAEGDRIVDLASDIVAQYDMAADEEISLFVDRNSLDWGSEWKKVIDGSLSSVVFFIPVITPRFFTSPSCRTELNAIGRRATEMGISGLIRPILYMDVPGFEEEEPADPLMALVKKFQWVDWREVRFTERSDTSYRRQVSKLALALVAANRSSESAQSTAAPTPAPVVAPALEPDVNAEVVPEVETKADTASAGDLSQATGVEPETELEVEPVAADWDDDEAGTLDHLDQYEGAMDGLAETMKELLPRIVEVGELATDAGEKASLPQNSSFSRKLGLLRKLATDLGVPVQVISELGEAFTDQLHDVDRGMRIIISRAPEEPGNEEDFRTLFGSVRGLAQSADESFSQMQSMSDAIEPLEQLSRELRPVARDLRKGISVFIEGNIVIQDWVTLIEESPLN